MNAADKAAVERILVDADHGGRAPTIDDPHVLGRVAAILGACNDPPVEQTRTGAPKGALVLAAADQSNSPERIP